MEVTTSLSGDEKTFTIYVEGDFNFSLLHEFKMSYSNEKDMVNKKIVVDLRKTTTVDSSALGMLLNMKVELNMADNEIYIVNCNDVVRKIFHITNFEKFFTIEN